MSPTTIRRALAAVGAVAAALALPAGASGFGTIDGKMGQHAEHEKITRVLSCQAVGAPSQCFQPLSMDMLAGTKGTLGGVGIPDSPLEIIGHPEAHCDDADYLPGKPYEPSAAQRAAAAIAACVNNFGRNLDLAVQQANLILDGDNKPIPVQADIAVPTCTMGTGSVGRAKCNTLEYLGRALHAAEDFWSHTNWGDSANPAKPQILKPAEKDADGKILVEATYDITNPLGLGRADLVPYLRYPVPTSLLPTGAQEQSQTAPISGCDDSAQDIVNWLDVIGTVVTGISMGDLKNLCPNRVGHSMLNKDKGEIDWRTGQTSNPSTPRAVIGDNFQRAVTGARAQAKAVWQDFAAALVTRYGPERGNAIVRAITNDTPWTSCTVGGSGNFALAAPRGPESSTRSVTTTISNRTGETLTCGEALLSSGQWASFPADAIPSGGTGSFRVESNITPKGGGGPEGSVTLAIGQTGYAVRYRWDNPIVGSNDMSCDVLRGGGVADSSAPYRCTVRNIKGNDATPTLEVTNR